MDLKDIAWCDISSLNLGDGYTVYAEFILDAVSFDYDRVFQVDDGSNANRRLVFFNRPTDQFRAQVANDGTIDYTSQVSLNGLLGSLVKSAIRLKLDDVNTAFNGDAGGGISAIADVAPTRLYLAASNMTTTNKPARLLLADLSIYDTPLTDAELAEVTV